MYLLQPDEPVICSVDGYIEMYYNKISILVVVNIMHGTSGPGVRGTMEMGGLGVRVQWRQVG